MGLFIKAAYTDACVGLDVLDYLLMVVVCGGCSQVKLAECSTLHIGEDSVDSVQQLELLHIALSDPVGHYM